MAKTYGTMTEAASDQHQHQSHSSSNGAARHSTDESPLLNHGPHHNQDLGHGNEVGPSAGFWSCVSLVVFPSLTSSLHNSTHQHNIVLVVASVTL